MLSLGEGLQKGRQATASQEGNRTGETGFRPYDLSFPEQHAAALPPAYTAASASAGTVPLILSII